MAVIGILAFNVELLLSCVFAFGEIGFICKVIYRVISGDFVGRELCVF